MGVRIAALDWYDGQNGFISNDSPALAICYKNGRCQIMKNELDESKLKFKFNVFFFFFLNLFKLTYTLSILFIFPKN